ncbi:MAG: hypothetical protein GXO34_05240, partial [Deltaproteobacteria bacterium]|nr:hypothetical protein [Deltaproteobacteria bacterium]
MILREKKKTKVYELAFSLKLKEPELLSILKTLDIEVSTKFSSLSEEEVERVKAWCRENQGPGVVEKRVGSGVRRRRRKVAPQPVAETESDAPESGEAETPAPADGEKPEAEKVSRDVQETASGPDAGAEKPVSDKEETAAGEEETVPAAEADAVKPDVDKDSAAVEAAADKTADEVAASEEAPAVETEESPADGEVETVPSADVRKED